MKDEQLIFWPSEYVAEAFTPVRTTNDTGDVSSDAQKRPETFLYEQLRLW